MDGFFFLFKVGIAEDRVETGRLVVAVTLSTMLVGVLSYYVIVHLMGLMPQNPLLEAFILIIGTFGGTIARHLAFTVWNRHLKNVKP